MKITQIRNATNRLEYAGKTFLIDPWLMPRHTFCFVDVPGQPYHTPDPLKEHLPMPFYDLPMSKEEILKDVDFIVLRSQLFIFGHAEADFAVVSHGITPSDHKR